MDKTAIKNFAIEARKILMKSAVTEAGFYGITESEIKEPTQKGNDFEVYETVAGTENRIYKNDIRRRANLVKAMQTQGFEQVIEETAYTWFNRIIAIRFMEVNNYLPTRVRVLSSEAGGSTPDIITQSDTVELGMNPEEIEQVRLAKQENRYDDAFRMLFIKQCNELHEILPGLFLLRFRDARGPPCDGRFRALVGAPCFGAQVVALERPVLFVQDRVDLFSRLERSAGRDADARRSGRVRGRKRGNLEGSHSFSSSL